MKLSPYSNTIITKRVHSNDAFLETAWTAMKELLESACALAVEKLLRKSGYRGDSFDVRIETPRSKGHGDFSCNVAMLLANPLKSPPREIAEQLLKVIGSADGLIERSEVAGPGFLNFWLKGNQWAKVLTNILALGDSYGSSNIGGKRKIQVEFVSANPTGPLSLGHGRQGVLGDCIARLLQFVGYQVTREYYFNNGGRQMRVLGESVKARYLEILGLACPPPESALKDQDLPWPESVDGLPVVFPRDGYQGNYIEDIATTIHEEVGEKFIEEPGEGRFRQIAEETIFSGIRDTTDSLGIVFDVYFNEKSLYENGKIEETLSALSALGLVYKKDGATWLKSEQFGLERDRVVVKSSGEPTYLLPDIAYHVDKLGRGFVTVIDLQGADHIDQFPYVKAATEALVDGDNEIELVLNQFVTLRSGDRSVKQSTRAANFITVDELVAEVGVYVFRLFMVQRKPEGHLDFDLDLASETDWTKNPAYYLQYTYARTAGIEREAENRGMSLSGRGPVDLTPLALPEEMEIIRKLGEFPEVALMAAESREPNHIPYYLRELAGIWNTYLQDGKRHRILGDDKEVSRARVALAKGLRTVMGNGLSLLGMNAPEKM